MLAILRNRYLLATLSAVALSCNRPPELQIDPLPSAESMVFHFGYCSGEQSVPGVDLLEVVRIDGGFKKEWCAVRSEGTGAVLENSWKYGNAVSGFTLEGCAALAPGRYVVSVVAHQRRYARGSREFSVNSDRLVTDVKGSCR